MPYLLTLLVLITAGANPAQPDLDALKQKATAALNGDMSHGRQYLQDAVDYADALADAGRDDDALKWYRLCLKYSLWRMDCQLAVVRILKKKGDTEQAEKILRPLMRYMEEDEYYIKACRELGEPVDPELPPLQKVPGAGPVIVMVPIGPVDALLLKQVAEDVSKSLNMPILVQDGRLPLPEPHFDPFVRIMKTICRQTRFDQELQEYFQAKLHEQNLEEENLNDPEPCKLILKNILKDDGMTPDAIDAQLELIAQSKQWSTDKLLDLVDKRTFPYQRKHAYYIGITKADMTRGEYNFLFGHTDPGLGVISYCRFTCPVTGEPPDRQRLARRLRIKLKQSVGWIFDLDPCSFPSCPVSSQLSLPEHDAKTETYCPECNAALKAAIQKNKLFSQTWEPPVPPPMGLRF